jgi:TctA family transporter
VPAGVKRTGAVAGGSARHRGAVPGAGADMAAWVSYSMAKRFSKEPEKFGTGHPEGLIEAGASNNASLASGWVPSLLFGIPGDTSRPWPSACST